jgi:hypothetical protein
MYNAMRHSSLALSMAFIAVSLALVLALRRVRAAAAAAALLAYALVATTTWGIEERFAADAANTAASTITDKLVPSMDMLVTAMGSTKKDQESKTSVKEREVKDMPNDVMLKYKRIGMFICHAKGADEIKYDKMMAFLGAASPQYQTE